eukprot:1155138-Pelagomonas_calceolata.AAC.2
MMSGMEATGEGLAVGARAAMRATAHKNGGLEDGIESRTRVPTIRLPHNCEFLCPRAHELRVWKSNKSKRMRREKGTQSCIEVAWLCAPRPAGG